MDIQNVLWKLHELGDSTVLDKETRQAAKLSAEVINNMRNMLDLGSGEDLKALVATLHEATSERLTVQVTTNSQAGQ